jgi:hypothetical protein
VIAERKRSRAEKQKVEKQINRIRRTYGGMEADNMACQSGFWRRLREFGEGFSAQTRDKAVLYQWRGIRATVVSGGTGE